MYATVLQLRSYLGQISDSVPNDALLTDCLTRATDMVRNAMRTALTDPTFDYAAYGVASTKIVKTYPTEYLPIPAHQIGSVTLVEYRSATGPETWATDATAWSEETDGRLYRASYWPQGRYRMTAVWGYGNTIPAAIEELTLELAVNLWRSKDKGGFSETIGVDGAGAVRMVAGFTKQQAQTVQDVALQLWQVSV